MKNRTLNGANSVPNSERKGTEAAKFPALSNNATTARRMPYRKSGSSAFSSTAFNVDSSGSVMLLRFGSASSSLRRQRTRSRRDRVSRAQICASATLTRKLRYCQSWSMADRSGHCFVSPQQAAHRQRRNPGRIYNSKIHDVHLPSATSLCRPSINWKILPLRPFRTKICKYAVYSRNCESARKYSLKVQATDAGVMRSFETIELNHARTYYELEPNLTRT